MIIEIKVTGQASDPPNLVEETKERLAQYLVDRGYALDTFPEVIDYEVIFAFTKQGSKPLFT
jgi:hypothetical protein